MALKNSNLYAERIYAEHPLALWTFDDDMSYLQLFTDGQQDLSDGSYWTYTNLDVENIEQYSTTPISDSPQARFSASSSAQSLYEISSTFSVSSSSFFSSEKSTACFSAHVYQTSIFISSFEIGISYGGSDYSEIYSFGSNVGWNKISHTFEVPENEIITFFIRATFSNNAYSTMADFQFQFNGVSLGQWSEQFNSSSKGFNDQSIPEEISHIVSSSSEYTCTLVDSYGLDDSLNGYYLIKNKQIYAENSGIPLVFGSNNSTSITQSEDGNPSIVIPGVGFLNEAGRYNSYTLETWIRLDNLSADRIKIIGPVFSTDGIYVEEGFLSIRVGGQCIKSYYVGKWYRPMLVHLKYNQNYITVYINGEEVITETIDVDTIDLPENEVDGKSQDWIGIYGNDLVSPFEIDCVSILPYDLPLEMAKRRFIYGQGVGELENSNASYRAETVLFDYSTAEYAANFIYPDMNRWRDAISINLDTSSSYILPIEYELPEFKSKSNTQYTDWLEGNRLQNINHPDNFDYFLMKPSYTSGISEPSLFYESLNITNENVAAIVGVFKADDLVDTQQPLMIFRNKSSYEAIKVVLEPDYFIVDGGNSSTVLFDDENDYGEATTEVFFGTDEFGDSFGNQDEDIFILKYIHVEYDGTETVLYEENVSRNHYFNAGINLVDFETNNALVGQFFSSLDNVSLTIGKNENDNFTGRIYNIHFVNSFSYEKDLTGYFSDGIVLQVTDTDTVYEELLQYTATYTLLPIAEECKFMLDIGIFGYWEDIQPLSYFGKYVTDIDGNKYYDLDMIQVNLNIPKNSYPVPELDTYYNTYDALQLQYGIYDDISGSATYQELASASVNYSDMRIDTSVKSYITFKEFDTALTKQYSSYINSEPVPSSSVITFDENSFDDTKYEFANNVIVIPPEENFENYYIGMHMEVKVRGINMRRFLIRRLELASIAFNDDVRTNINTRYSETITPFTRTGDVFDYKSANPFTIYKETSPFLYLTDDSGLISNDYPTSASAVRGFYTEINHNEEDTYIFGSLQMWMRHADSNIGTETKLISSIKMQDSSINIYLEPEADGRRAFLHVHDADTGENIQNIVFFQDGNVVSNPVVYPQRWTSIGISFLDPLIFNGYEGRIEFYQDILFNNIVKYMYSDNSVNTFKALFSKWFQVLSNEENSPPVNTWEYVKEGDAGTTNTWRQATSSLQLNQYTINGENIYNNQTGISVSVTDDTSRLSIMSNGADVMTDVVWDTLELSPV